MKKVNTHTEMGGEPEEGYELWEDAHIIFGLPALTTFLCAAMLLVIVLVTVILT